MEVHLGQTVSTPARIDEPVEEVSGSVTVISEPAIESQQPVGAAEVVRDVSGVSIRESGTLGEQATLMLRGAESYQSLTLLDGIRFNTPFRGSFDLGGLLLDNVGQIEIVRGAQSSLYGSEAMGGVINFQTRKARLEREGYVFAEAGNLGAFREGFGLGGNPKWGNYTLTVSRTDLEGYGGHDRYGATALSSRLQLDLSPRSQVVFIPRFQGDKKELRLTALEFTLPIEVVPDDNSMVKRNFYSNVLSYRHEISAGWEIILRGGIVRSRLDLDNPSVTGADPADPVASYSYFEKTEEREVTFELQQNFEWKENQVLTVGAEYFQDAVKSDVESSVFPFPFNIEEKRRNQAGYIQQLFKWRKTAVLQLGLRLDDDSNFGPVSSPKVSGSYDLRGTGTKIRGGWGTGFRAPTIQELGFGGLLDPDFDPAHLKPERSQNWEVGAHQRLWGNAVEFDVVYFQIVFKDLIERFPAVDNVARAQSRGVEAGLSIKPHPSAQISANYTYLDTENKETGEELPFRTRNRWNLKFLLIPLVNLTVDVDINIVSKQSLPVETVPDGSGNPATVDVFNADGSGFTRVDAAVSYEFIHGFFFARNVRIFANVKNLFDKEYQEVPGFPAPGFRFMAGIRAAL